MNPYRSIHPAQRASMHRAMNGAALAGDTDTAYRLARLLGHADATTDNPIDAADYANRAYDSALDFANRPAILARDYVDACHAAYALLVALEDVSSTPPAPAAANTEAA